MSLQTGSLRKNAILKLNYDSSTWTIAVEIQNIPPSNIKTKDIIYATATEVVVEPKTEGSTEPAIKAPVNTHIAPINQKLIVLGSAIKEVL